ncbi:D-aminoacyl-tRNA deacylase [Scopulibacillus cellulosilyticus]|uniref:D-aminoacyl-tRNA deacylase n=1 Tax=Scopulibacillus cellulosilyticus TaxID=2665665 RepID=A0ABW2PV19_9BACL
MKVVVQRAKNAAVIVDGETVGQIDNGLLLLVGIKHDDTIDDLKYTADKIAGLRIFEDHEEKMNWSVQDVKGDILSVSQFTLYGDVSKGRRPNFMEAAKPDQAQKLYDQFNHLLKEKGLRVETGRFGAMMDVSFTNDGPVTLIVESKRKN